MTSILKSIKSKINELMRTLIIVGVILVLLAVLIAWSEYLLRLMVALFVLITAYSLFYGACKLHSIKKLL